MAVEFGGDVSTLLDRLRSLEPDERRGFLLRFFKLDEVYVLESGTERINRLWNVLRANLRTAVRYAPKPYNGRVVVFRAADGVGVGDKDATLGWNRLAQRRRRDPSGAGRSCRHLETTGSLRLGGTTSKRTRPRITERSAFMARLIRFLLRSSRGSFFLAVATGLTAGLGGVGLLALVTTALRAEPPSSRLLGPAFAIVCVVAVVARVLSQVALIRVAQASISRLVGHFCGRILALPLQRFEGHEPGALLAVLTEDVAVLTAALSGLPLLFVNVTVVLGCFVFLAVVSPPVFLCTLAFAVPAIAAQGSLRGRGDALLAKVRAEQDALTGHFRALVEGFKDLKLNRDRRTVFLNESIREASRRVREGNTAGLSIFAAVGGWGQFLHFGYIGFLLFGLPLFIAVPRDVLAASVLTLLYAVSPLDAILGFLPLLGRAVRVDGAHRGARHGVGRGGSRTGGLDSPCARERAARGRLKRP